MPRSKTLFFVLFFLSALFLWSEVSFSESLKDGVLMREGDPIILKDGSVIDCESFIWLVSTADFIQYDKGGLSHEILIDEVDLEKTFGPEIAKEYDEAKEELKKGYEKAKEEREKDVEPAKEGSTPQKVKKESKPSAPKKQAVSKKPVKIEPQKPVTNDTKTKKKKDTAKKKKAQDKKKKSASKKK